MARFGIIRGRGLMIRGSGITMRGYDFMFTIHLDGYDDIRTHLRIAFFDQVWNGLDRQAVVEIRGCL